MTSLTAGGRFCGLLTAFALITGCGGAGSSVNPAMQPNVVRANDDRSWISPNAKTSDLVYVSGQDTDVYVYAVPQYKLVGTLASFLNGIRSACADKAGDVYFVLATGGNEAGPTKILEYTHAGTKPIATLLDPYVDSETCAVDPVTGDLAVINTVLNDLPDLTIYKHGRGVPRSYPLYTGGIVEDPPISCAYDDQGNLFIDGYGLADGGSANFSFALAELPKDGRTVRPVIMKYKGGKRGLTDPGGMTWDGKHLAIAQAWATTIYEFSVKDLNAVEAGFTPITWPSNAAGNSNGPLDNLSQFAIQGDQLVAPIPFDNATSGIVIWKYPNGGAMIKELVVPGGVVSAAVYSKGV